MDVAHCKNMVEFFEYFKKKLRDCFFLKYTCPSCGDLQFSILKDLYSHLLEKHGQDKVAGASKDGKLTWRFTDCKYCGKTMLNADSELSLHLKNKHETDIEAYQKKFGKNIDSVGGSLPDNGSSRGSCASVEAKGGSKGQGGSQDDSETHNGRSHGDGESKDDGAAHSHQNANSGPPGGDGSRNSGSQGGSGPNVNDGDGGTRSSGGAHVDGGDRGKDGEFSMGPVTLDEFV